MFLHQSSAERMDKTGTVNFYGPLLNANELLIIVTDQAEPECFKHCRDNWQMNICKLADSIKAGNLVVASSYNISKDYKAFFVEPFLVWMMHTENMSPETCLTDRAIAIVQCKKDYIESTTGKTLKNGEFLLIMNSKSLEKKKSIAKEAVDFISDVIQFAIPLFFFLSILLYLEYQQVHFP